MADILRTVRKFGLPGLLVLFVGWLASEVYVAGVMVVTLLNTPRPPIV